MRQSTQTCNHACFQYTERLCRYCSISLNAMKPAQQQWQQKEIFPKESMNVILLCRRQIWQKLSQLWILSGRIRSAINPAFWHCSSDHLIVTLRYCAFQKSPSTHVAPLQLFITATRWQWTKLSYKSKRHCSCRNACSTFCSSPSHRWPLKRVGKQLFWSCCNMLARMGRFWARAWKTSPGSWISESLSAAGESIVHHHSACICKTYNVWSFTFLILDLYYALQDRGHWQGLSWEEAI